MVAKGIPLVGTAGNGIPLGGDVKCGRIGSNPFFTECLLTREWLAVQGIQ